jgi:preprotein translocase subunit YajC
MIDYAYAMGVAPGAAGEGQPSPLIGLLPILLMFVIFYFLLIRPQQRRQKEHQKMVGALKRNDEVVTTGGVHGKIMDVKESSVILKIDDHTKIEVQRNCIGFVKKTA